MQLAIDVPEQAITARMKQAAAEAFISAAKHYQFAEIMDIKDAAAFCDCTPETFRKQFVAQGLPVASIGGLKRIRKTQLLEFIADHEY